jgi:hypothetical protein
MWNSTPCQQQIIPPIAASACGLEPLDEHHMHAPLSNILSTFQQPFPFGPLDFGSELLVPPHDAVTTQLTTQEQQHEPWTDICGLNGYSSGIFPVLDRDVVHVSQNYTTQLIGSPVLQEIAGSLIPSWRGSAGIFDGTKLSSNRLVRPLKKPIGQIMGIKSTTKIARRSGPLRPQKRQKVAETRKKGACEKCRLDKVEVHWNFVVKTSHIQLTKLVQCLRDEGEKCQRCKKIKKDYLSYTVLTMICKPPVPLIQLTQLFFSRKQADFPNFLCR